MRIRSIRLAAAAGVLLLAAGALIFITAIALTENNGSIAAAESGYQGTQLDQPAPAFTLTDQHGDEVSLADYRGQAVVLTLLDPICTDICPVYANHYRLAYNALDEHQKEQVVFLAFNANDTKTSVDAISAATQKWQLDDIPTFHFLTGSPEKLNRVWDAYNVEASGDPKTDKPDELRHTPAIFLIDQSGQLRRYISTSFEGAPLPSALIVEHATSLLAEEEGWW